MHKANVDIRKRANEAGIRLWQIADKLNMLDVNFSKKMRHELPDTEKQRIFSIIEELKTQKGA